MTQPTCPRCGYGLLAYWQELEPGLWTQRWVCDPCRESDAATFTEMVIAAADDPALFSRLAHGQVTP